MNSGGMKHVLAIDAGTTGVTCLMLGEDGRIAGRGYREIPQYFPEPGWVEHDAGEILECVRAAAREAIADAGKQPAAIGIIRRRVDVAGFHRLPVCGARGSVAHFGEPSSWIS